MQQNCFSVGHFALRVFEFKSLDIIHLESFKIFLLIIIRDVNRNITNNPFALGDLVIDAIYYWDRITCRIR